MRAVAAVAVTVSLVVCANVSAAIAPGEGIDGIELGESMPSVRHHLGHPHVIAVGRQWSYLSGNLDITFDRHGRVLLVGTTLPAQRTAKGIHTVRYTTIGSGPAKSPVPGTGFTQGEVLQAYPSAKCGSGPTIDGVTQSEVRCQVFSRRHSRGAETTFVFYTGSSIAVPEVNEIFVSYTHE